MAFAYLSADPALPTLPTEVMHKIISSYISELCIPEFSLTAVCNPTNARARPLMRGLPETNDQHLRNLLRALPLERATILSHASLTEKLTGNLLLSLDLGCSQKGLDYYFGPEGSLKLLAPKLKEVQLEVDRLEDSAGVSYHLNYANLSGLKRLHILFKSPVQICDHVSFFDQADAGELDDEAMLRAQEVLASLIAGGQLPALATLNGRGMKVIIETSQIDKKYWPRSMDWTHQMEPDLSWKQISRQEGVQNGDTRKELETISDNIRAMQKTRGDLYHEAAVKLMADTDDIESLNIIFDPKYPRVFWKPSPEREWIRHQPQMQIQSSQIDSCGPPHSVFPNWF